MPRVLNRMGLCSLSPLHRHNQTLQTSFSEFFFFFFFQLKSRFLAALWTVCVLNCGTRAASCLLMTPLAAEFSNRNKFKSLTWGQKQGKGRWLSVFDGNCSLLAWNNMGYVESSFQAFLSLVRMIVLKPRCSYCKTFPKKKKPRRWPVEETKKKHILQHLFNQS